MARSLSMHCPKCGQNFEEGSRRFCPTDGARLISDSAEAKGGSEGIFSSLLPRIQPSGEFDESVPSSAARTPAPNTGPDLGKTGDEMFLELDEIDLNELFEDEPSVSPAAVPVQPSSQPQGSFKPVPPFEPSTRKVDPARVPAGHVDLSSADRVPPFNFNFDTDDPDMLIGRIVKGRYKVAEFLGGDPSGIAYMADDKLNDDKKVLIRVVLEPPDNEILASILAEERLALSHFSHPNVARIIDSGEFPGGKQFLVSEYIDSLSVADILSIHGRFPLERVARVIRQAAAALSEAHQQGILHRDIRPENIIIENASDGSEHAMLVNFGASKGEPSPSNFAYKSPEVLQGRIVTVSSDIFSLAVVAYEMITGLLPFAGTNAREVSRAQNAGEAVLPSDRRPELSTSVDDVMQKAMAFAPADRFSKAREFGDALYAALMEVPSAVSVAPSAAMADADTISAKPARPVSVRSSGEVRLSPAGGPSAASSATAAEPAWKNRSPEPPAQESSLAKVFWGLGILIFLGLLGFGIYYLRTRPEQLDVPSQAEFMGSQPAASPNATETEMPPQPRTITQPPETNFFQNTKQNIRGDLLVNFVGFSLYYPKHWKVTGPQQRASANSRGKFLDIARNTPDGRMQEQMLISYYPSRGTFSADAEKFPQLVKEANDTLKGILPNYQVVSQGEIKINGDWRAYEVKFQGGTDQLKVWGRRLFIPAARPGTRNGFEITMLASSLAPEVKSADDVGVYGELAGILYSFEPSQNF